MKILLLFQNPNTEQIIGVMTVKSIPEVASFPYTEPRLFLFVSQLHSNFYARIATTIPEAVVNDLNTLLHKNNKPLIQKWFRESGGGNWDIVMLSNIALFGDTINDKAFFEPYFQHFAGAMGVERSFIDDYLEVYGKHSPNEEKLKDILEGYGGESKLLKDCKILFPQI